MRRKSPASNPCVSPPRDDDSKSANGQAAQGSASHDPSPSHEHGGQGIASGAERGPTGNSGADLGWLEVFHSDAGRDGEASQRRDSVRQPAETPVAKAPQEVWEEGDCRAESVLYCKGCEAYWTLDLAAVRCCVYSPISTSEAPAPPIYKAKVIAAGFNFLPIRKDFDSLKEAMDAAEIAAFSIIRDAFIRAHLILSGKFGCC